MLHLCCFHYKCVLFTCYHHYKMKLKTTGKKAKGNKFSLLKGHIWWCIQYMRLFTKWPHSLSFVKMRDVKSCHDCCTCNVRCSISVNSVWLLNNVLYFVKMVYIACLPVLRLSSGTLEGSATPLHRPHIDVSFTMSLSVNPIKQKTVYISLTDQQWELHRH